MPAILESRQLLFSFDVLREAVLYFRAARPDSVPHGAVRRVRLSCEDPLELTAELEQPGSNRLREVTFANAQIAALLILFCRRQKIPLPRRADKFLRPEAGGISLMISKELPMVPFDHHARPPIRHD